MSRDLGSVALRALRGLSRGSVCCALVSFAAPLAAQSLGIPPAPPPPPLEVTVQQTRALEPPTPSLRIGAEEGRRGAGTQGDAVKSLQALPGLARSGAGGGEIIAWGAAPRETRVYLDGVELPALYHGSGIRSVLPSGWISRLTLLPGAYGSEFGRGLGGVVTLETRTLDIDEWHASAQLDPLDLAVAASVPLGSDLAFAVAARQGLIHQTVRGLPDVDADSLLAVPRYRDAQARLHAELGAGESLDVVALASRDDLERGIPSSDPAARVREERELAFARAYVRYVRRRGDDQIEVTPFVGVDRTSTSTTARGSRAGLRLRALPYGLRASHAFMPAPALRWRLGVDARGAATTAEREGSLTLPSREGDPYVFGQVALGDSATERLAAHVLDVASYAELTQRYGGLTIASGVRVDTYLLESDRVRPLQGRVPPVGRTRARALLEPRLSLAYALDPQTELVAAGGLYHQPPDPEDLSATFGNPELGLARAVHLMIGERVRFTPVLSLELLAFYERQSDLAARSPLTTPDVAEVLQANGAGRSFGVQWLLRRNLHRGWSGWLAATLSRSERWLDGGEPRPFDADQPLVVSTVVQKLVGDWSFAVRARAASGSPRTPVRGATFNASADRFEPVLGPINSSRLPAFFQLDVRVDRRWLVAPGMQFSLYADALNVTARRNTEEWVYGADYRERRGLLGLPPLLVLGVRLER